MKTTITKYKTFHKVITYEINTEIDLVDPDLDLLDEIYDGIDYDLEEELFAKAESHEGEPYDEDRFDVYDNKGEQLIGGHL